MSVCTLVTGVSLICPAQSFSKVDVTQDANFAEEHRAFLPFFIPLS